MTYWDYQINEYVKRDEVWLCLGIIETDRSSIVSWLHIGPFGKKQIKKRNTILYIFMCFQTPSHLCLFIKYFAANFMIINDECFKLMHRQYQTLEFKS